MSHCDTCSCFPRDTAQSSPHVRLPALGNATVIATLDAQIKQLYVTIFELRQQRNSYLPASRLPPEILSDIFRTVRDCSSFEGWMRITHVSSGWRAVALANPSLWNTVDMSKPLLAAETIHRSQDVPAMRVRLSSTSEEDRHRGDPNPAATRSILRLLSRPTCRIGHIDLAGNHGRLDDILQALLSSTRPSLRMLRLTPLGAYPDYDSFEIPRAVCDVEQPNIEVLHITNCTMPWSSPLFSEMRNLRDLDIQYDEFPTEDEILIMHMLNNFPMLERLSLVAIHIGSGLQLPPDFRVALPRLSTLHVNDTFDSVNFVLQHLDLPQACHTKIEYDCDVLDHHQLVIDEALRALDIILSSRLDPPVPSRFPEICVTFGRSRIEVMIYGSSEVLHQFTITRCTPDYNHAIAGYVFPLAQTTLRIEYGVSLPIECADWFDALSRTTASTIHLISPKPCSILVDSITEQERGHLTLPRMKTLIMEGTAMYFSPESDERVFLGVLKQRAQGGMLEEVVLRNCTGLATSALEEWSSAVPTLVVEGGEEHESRAGAEVSLNR